MNDDFMTQLRKTPRPDFADSLYAKLNHADESTIGMQYIAPPTSPIHANGVFKSRESFLETKTKRHRSRYLLTAATAAMLLLVGSVMMSMALRGTSNIETLAQSEPFPLPPLQVISQQNISQLTELATLGLGTIDSIVWSPDGTQLAAGGSLGVWLFDADALETSGHFLETASPANEVAYSPDGTILASAHRDGTIILWDTATETRKLTLSGHTSSVNSIAFSPDGTLFASGSGENSEAVSDNSVYLWNIQSGEQITILQGHTDIVYSIAFSPDGQILASGGADNVLLWDVNTIKEMGEIGNVSSMEGIRFINPDTLPYIENEINTTGVSLAFTLDSATLAVGENDRISLWNIQTRERIGVISIADGIAYVTDLAFTSDGQTLATASLNGGVKLFNAATKMLKPSTINPRFQRWVNSVAVSTDDTKLAVTDRSSHIIIFDLNSGDELNSVTPVTGLTYRLSANSENQLAVINGDNNISLWDLQTGSLKHQVATDDDVLADVSFSPDGQIIGYIGLKIPRGQSFKLLDTTALEVLQDLSQGETSPMVFTFSPDGRLLAIVGLQLQGNGVVEIWDLETEESRFIHSEHSELASLVFSPDGNQVAVGTFSGETFIFDSQTSELRHTFEEGNFNTRIFWLSYTNDGKHLFTGSQTLAGGQNINETNSSIKLYDLQTEDEVYSIDFEHTLISSVAINPDNSLMAGIAGGKIYLWNSQSGELLYTVNVGVNSYLYGLTFNHDGTLLISGSDGVVRLWGIPAE